jgi:transposase
MTLTEEKTHHELLQTNDRLCNQILQLKAENQWLKEQLGLAKKRLYGPSSEQTTPGQAALLFNEAETEAAPEPPAPETETVTYVRRKSNGQREQQLENLPVEEIEYHLTEAQCVCPACDGPMHEMGADIRQEIKIVPPSVTLVKHIRAKYACRRCERNEINTPILTASMPTPAFPNSLASPSAVAHIMSQKFVEGSPLYRQEQSLARLGFELSRQTMANWMLAGADWLQRIYDRMHTLLLERDILHADETTVQVLKEAGRSAQSQSYMWLYRTGRDRPPIVLFEYQPTRAREHAQKFLTGYRGFLNVDGYAGYEGLSGVTLVGCLAHARRKFVDAITVLPKPERNKGTTYSHAGLAFCDRLFAIERDLRDATPQERHAGREKRSKPALDAFRLWLDDMDSQALPRSGLGTAVSYCRNQWPKLIAFLEDGRLEIDNNRSERSIKPFVIGRKNWLFANTPRGARASSLIYSIVETAKENALNPFTCQRRVKIPQIAV